jgi:hypothetical protein
MLIGKKQGKISNDFADTYLDNLTETSKDFEVY